MIEHLLNIAPDWLFIAGGELTDSSSTYVFYRNARKKFGEEAAVYIETNDETRRAMKKHGAAKGLFYESIKLIARLSFTFGITYVSDCVMDIEDNFVNFHHFIAYGLGMMKYCAGLGNFARLYNYDRLGEFFSFPINAPRRWLGLENKYSKTIDEAIEKDTHKED